MQSTTVHRWWGERTTVDYSENIERGMKLLDQKMPGWERYIDPDKLHLYSPRSCVLGQIGRNRYGLHVTGFDHMMGRLGLSMYTLTEYGFDESPYSVFDTRLPGSAFWRYHQLRKQWQAALAARAAEKAAPAQRDLALVR